MGHPKIVASEMVYQLAPTGLADDWLSPMATAGGELVVGRARQSLNDLRSNGWHTKQGGVGDV